ncbi:MAG: hypothetical protein M0Z67_10560, partial [Nitrospiraceae bacterium]|nr:hypothetical protein [Nitrospiraceae bacterium]
LLAETPLPSASTFGSIHYYEHSGFSHRGLAPHKFTPVPGVHKRLKLAAPSITLLCFSLAKARLRPAA